MQDRITDGSHLLFMAEESAISTIEAGRFSSDTIIKDSITIRTDLLSEVDLVFNFIKKHISRGYYFDGTAQRKERWEYPIEGLSGKLLSI